MRIKFVSWLDSSAKMSCTSILSFLPSQAWNNVFGAANIMISITATLENVLVLLVFLLFKDLQTLSNRTLVSLSVTDLLVGLLVAPIHAAHLLNEDILHNCTSDAVRRYAGAALCGISAFTIGSISYDRYLHMTKLNNYNMFMSSKKSWIFISVSWILPGIVPASRFIAEKIYVSIFVSFMTVNFLILFVCYIMILSALRSKSEWRVRSRKLYEQQMKTFKTVMVLLTCFTLMNFPIVIPLIMTAIDDNIKKDTVGAVFITGITLVNLNSAINPVIYYFRNQQFRQKALRLFRRSTNKVLPNVSKQGSSNTDEQVSQTSATI